MIPEPEKINESIEEKQARLYALNEEYKNMKQSSFPLRDGIDPNFSGNKEDFMTNLVIEKIKFDNRFQSLEKTLKNLSPYISVGYFDKDIGSNIKEEKSSIFKTLLLLLGFYIFSTMGNFITFPFISEISLLGQISTALYFLYSMVNSKILFFTFLGLLFRLVTNSLPKKYLLAKRLEKKITPEDMFNISSLYLKSQYEYAQSVGNLNATPEQHSNYEKGIDNIYGKAQEDLNKCKEKLNSNQPVFLYCGTILEYGILLQCFRNNYEQMLNFENRKIEIKNEIDNLKNELATKTPEWENIYKKL